MDNPNANLDYLPQFRGLRRTNPLDGQPMKTTIACILTLTATSLLAAPLAWTLAELWSTVDRQLLSAMGGF